MNAKMKRSKKYRIAMWLFSPLVFMLIMLVMAKYLKKLAIAIEEGNL